MQTISASRFPFGRNFYFIQFSAILNSVASRCSYLALAWWVLSVTHDATAFAIYVGIGTGADILARGLFGSLGDTYNKQRLIAMCYWFSLISTLGIATLASTQLYLPILLVIFQALSGLAVGIREPLQSSIVPFQVTKEQLSSAIQWRAAAMTIVTFCSPIIGTGFISVMGAHNTLWVSFGIIILSIALLNFAKNIDATPENAPKRPKWNSGFSAIRRLPPEISLIKVTFIMNLGLFPFLGVALPAFFHQNYAQRPWLFGIADTAFAVGMFLGATQLGKRLNHAWGRANSTYSGYFALGIGVLITAIMCQLLTQFILSYFIVMCLGMCLAGCGLMVAVTNTSFMRSAASPQHYLNRISASSTFSTGIASPLGVVLSGLCVTYLGLYMTLIVLSLILILGSISSFFSANLRQVLALPDDKIYGAYEHHFPNAFTKNSIEPSS